MIKHSDTDGDKARAYIGTIALVVAVMCYTWSFRNRVDFVIGSGGIASVSLIVMLVKPSNSTLVDTAAWIAIVAVIVALCLITRDIASQNQVPNNKKAIGIAAIVIAVCTGLYGYYASGIWEFVMVVMIFFIAALLIAVGYENYDIGAVFQRQTEFK